MAVYTVYITPDSGATVLAADRVRVVSDRFAVLAVLFGPIWLACQRLWWALMAYVTAVAVLSIASYELHLPAATFAVVLLIMGIFLGLEGPVLQEFALSRRGYHVAGLVTASNREQAERDFFRRWTAVAGSRGNSRATIPPGRDDGQIIGVFPTAGGLP
jgi:hypothetical protein